jgi:regulator of protease activity HflC (stomatin/prohibitin superfamily)
MSGLWAVVVVLVVLALLGFALLGFALSARIVKQYERGVLFRLGRVVGLPTVAC